MHDGNITTFSVFLHSSKTYIFTLVLAYSCGSGFGLQDTLLNPILSDHFGFRVKDEVYTLLAVSIFQLIGGILK